MSAQGFPHDLILSSATCNCGCRELGHAAHTRLLRTLTRATRVGEEAQARLDHALRLETQAKRIAAGHEDCEACDGLGAHAYPGHGETVWEPCSHCEGTGFFSEDAEPCECEAN